MVEPGGLPSMGSHRVGHNWSDLAAAASKKEGIPKVSISCAATTSVDIPQSLLGLVVAQIVLSLAFLDSVMDGIT